MHFQRGKQPVSLIIGIFCPPTNLQFTPGCPPQYGGYHTFKWVDEAVMDEIQTLHNANFAQDDRINLMTLGLNGVHVDPHDQYHDVDMDGIKERLQNL